MVRKPITRPARKPARASVVVKAARKPRAAKKSSKNSKVKNSQKTWSAVDPATMEAAAEKIRASVAARKRTIAATTIFAGPGRPKPASAAEVDIPRTQIKKRPAAMKAVTKKRSSAPRARRRTAVDRFNDLPPDAPLTDRVTHAIERELDSIQKIVGRRRLNEALRTEAERRARTLASLARTLTELKKVQGGNEQRPAEDDDRPRDLDELRRRIAERLARRPGGRPPIPVDGNDAGRERLPE
ncbi:hypothetical protein AB7714_01075 [Tardiphaga sp. 1201_B9_N1_1]|jgi:hypothetical protein|uniref:hypothetical protein n=1 Tax=unclassified Tardiphaga TaxID=2631404 RepID=UPI0011C3E032